MTLKIIKLKNGQSIDEDLYESLVEFEMCSVCENVNKCIGQNKEVCKNEFKLSGICK